MNPHLTAVCVTGGRIQHLQNALACFLSQTHENSKLIIYNTCQQQTLSYEHERVQIVNARPRPSNLGEARNNSVALVPEDSWVVVFDDDDSYCSNFLESFSNAIETGMDWVWLNQQFYSEGFRIKKTIKGTMNVVAFTKKAFTEIGGYTNLSVGEDAQFVGRLTQQFTGKRVELKPEQIGFIYQWASQAYHISGLGMGQEKTAWVRFENDLKQRIRNGAEPHGDITLKPKLRSDWDEMAAKFIGKKADAVAKLELPTSNGKVCIFLSDPSQDTWILCEHIKQRYEQPDIIIAGQLSEEAIKAKYQFVIPASTQVRPQITSQKPAAERKLIHCVQMHETKHDKRIQTAQNSWQSIYAQGVIKSYYRDFERSSKDIGDKKRVLPFLKDVLARGMEHADSDSDILFFTNSDNTLHPNLPGALRFYVSVFDCVCSRRCEFKNVTVGKNVSPDVWARHSTPHFGRDLFAFTVGWLKDHCDEIGDSILGAAVWDWHLAAVIRRYHGIESTRKNFEQDLWPAEIPIGLIGHEYHPPYWQRKDNMNSPSENWNWSLFQKYCEQYLPSIKFNQQGKI